MNCGPRCGGPSADPPTRQTQPVQRTPRTQTFHQSPQPARRARPQKMNQQYFTQTGTALPGRDDLADSLMDELGDGVVWNEASALSMSEYQENQENSCPPCDEDEEEYFDEICEPCEDEDDDIPPELLALTQSPSNISVYDAEELNITTAPRNADWDIPRCRIWQTVTNGLDEAEKEEENEFNNFVSNLQSERRGYFEA